MDTSACSSLRLREMALNERPQERLEKHGPGALSDTELLAMLLRSGSREMDVMALSSSIVSQAGSLAGLLAWSDSDFKQLKGIGKVKALQLIAVLEVSRRVLRQSVAEQPVFESAESVHAYMRPIVAGLEVEKLYALCLNRKNRLIRHVEATSGTVSSSLAHPREVFREAIRLGSSAIICAHNHPSGDPAPSKGDIEVTRALREAAKVIDIPLLDHVIIGAPGAGASEFFSFAEAGLL